MKARKARGRGIPFILDRSLVENATGLLSMRDIAVLFKIKG
jgi:hypothetical protein